MRCHKIVSLSSILDSNLRKYANACNPCIVFTYLQPQLSLMATVEEYSSEGAEIVVAYSSRQLGEFRTPKSWSAAVGSGPDLSAATMTELLERSVVAAEEDKASTNESNCDENFPNYHTMSYCMIFDLRDIMQPDMDILHVVRATFSLSI